MLVGREEWERGAPLVALDSIDDQEELREDDLEPDMYKYYGDIESDTNV